MAGRRGSIPWLAVICSYILWIYSAEFRIDSEKFYCNFRIQKLFRILHTRFIDSLLG